MSFVLSVIVKASMNRIALQFSVRVDDRKAESAIIASNDLGRSVVYRTTKWPLCNYLD